MADWARQICSWFYRSENMENLRAVITPARCSQNLRTYLLLTIFGSYTDSDGNGSDNDDNNNNNNNLGIGNNNNSTTSASDDDLEW